MEKTTNKLEETEQSFWKKGGNLGLNHDDIIRDQHELKDKENALKEQAIALASNPATPICLCKELAVTTYNEIMSSEESRAVKYSYPIVSKLYKSLLEEFKGSYSASTDSYKTLSKLV